MVNIFDKPHHINAIADDLAGNNGIGRYVFLPGSDGRANAIAQNFAGLSVKEHPRGHNLYKGTLDHNGHKIDVAAISSGMGCPSMEIILHELHLLGAKRFLRVGTAGSLQEKLIKIGDIINTQASVRDENTTKDYISIDVPAVASTEMMQAILQASKDVGLNKLVHTGLVHCKSSFYAREFYAGPRAEEHQQYMQQLMDYGVLASEMETSALFIQSQFYNHQLQEQGNGPEFKVIAGAVLGIGAIPPTVFMTAEQEKPLTENVVKIAIQAIKVLAESERK